MTEAVSHIGPFCGKPKAGSWHIYEVDRVVSGPNRGAERWESRRVRWWHPTDLRIFVADRRDAHLMFGWGDYTWGARLSILWHRLRDRTIGPERARHDR